MFNFLRRKISKKTSKFRTKFRTIKEKIRCNLLIYSGLRKYIALPLGLEPRTL